MNKLIIIVLSAILFLPSSIFACQYTAEETYQQIETALTYQDSSIKIADALTFSEFINSRNMSTFIVFNPNPYEIKAFITYTVEVFITGEQRAGLRIEPKGYGKVSESCYKDNNFGECSIKKDNITYFLSEPTLLFPKEINITKTKLICKLCNDAPCLDDGTECSINEECGGGFCVEKICNNKPECFLDNCKCERFDKVQCKNTRCVSKNTLPEGVEPFCDQECKSNYTDDNSGKCTKSPAQINEEADKKATEKSIMEGILLTLSIVVVIAIIVLAIYFNKKNTKKREEKAKKQAREAAEKEYEEAKKEQERAHNEYLKKTNLLIQNIRVQEEALSDKRKQLSESKNIINEAENNLAKTKKIKEKIESEMKDITEMEKEFSESKAKLKDLTKPKHSLTRGFWEWQNPEKNYYPCYWNGDRKNNNIEIHKDLAEKEIFSFYRKWFNKYYPGKNFKDFVVHHIDKDISNYELANLVIITHNEHEKLHKKSQHKNWASGVEELKEFGIKQPHIDELGGKSITDPYEILGIPKNASKEEIKASYYRLSSQNHPDKVNHLDKQFQILADSRFKKINEAYHKLVD